MELFQVHHVRTLDSVKYVTDEDGNTTLRPVRRMVKSDVDRIAFPDLGTFEVQPDGTFYLPRVVAEHFLAQPGWNAGPSPFEAEEVSPLAAAVESRKPSHSELEAARAEGRAEAEAAAKKAADKVEADAKKKADAEAKKGAVKKVEADAEVKAEDAGQDDVE